MLNDLQHETSPYLLQHANNPVHWQPWHATTLANAQQKDQLLVVSIGYAACHWCHVMEHESFENQEVANIMNSSFTSIKIDREERPDIDALYMKAVQIMTNQGGWPLNVVCLPDGRPVWGGTYFVKDDWIQSLEQLAAMYKNDPDKIIEYAKKLHDGLKSISLINTSDHENDITFDKNVLENLVARWRKSFDMEYGGMSRTPKFMMPNNYAFLMRYAHQNKDQELHDFVDLTLTKMAYGGLFDTIGGGFSRYSVDEKWHVPHFEKMLYDNAQLLSLYADAFKRTKNLLYQEVSEKIIAFLEQNLTSPNGGFYCALDADSNNQAGALEEGAFYVWTKQELQKLIPAAEFELFSQVFNINSFGLWEHGNYVLIQNDSLDSIAIKNRISKNSLSEMKISWEQLLFDEREKRMKPRLDNKCLCSWNGMMIVGLIDAYQAFGNEQHLEIAVKNANFIIKNMWSTDGSLYHNFTNKTATIEGFLEDYAHVIAAFISLFEVTLDQKWILDAKKLMDYCLVHFLDIKVGFFTFSAISKNQFLAAQFETEDNVIPASNSVMAHNLFKLSTMFESHGYREILQKMLNNIIPNIDYPSAFSNWLLLYMNLAKTQKEVAVLGVDAKKYCQQLFGQYSPNCEVYGSEKPSDLPFFKNRFVAQKTLFYVCENKTCGLPIDDFSTLKM